MPRTYGHAFYSFLSVLILSCSVPQSDENDGKQKSDANESAEEIGVKLGDFTLTDVISREFENFNTINLVGKSLANSVAFFLPKDKSGDFSFRYNRDLTTPHNAHYVDVDVAKAEELLNDVPSLDFDYGSGTLAVKNFKPGGHFTFEVDMKFREASISGSIDTSRFGKYKNIGDYTKVIKITNTNIKNVKFTRASFSGSKVDIATFKQFGIYDVFSDSESPRQFLSIIYYSKKESPLVEGKTYEFDIKDVGRYNPALNGGLSISSGGILVKDTRPFTPQTGHVTFEKIPNAVGEKGIISFRADDGPYYIEGKIEAVQCQADAESIVPDLGNKEEFFACVRNAKSLD